MATLNEKVSTLTQDLETAQAKLHGLETCDENRRTFLATAPSEDDIKQKQLELDALKAEVAQMADSWQKEKRHMSDLIGATFGLNSHLFQKKRDLSAVKYTSGIRDTPLEDALEDWVAGHVNGNFQLHHADAKHLTLSETEKKRFPVVKSFGQWENTHDYTESVTPQELFDFFERAPVLSYYTVACCQGQTGYLDSCLNSDVPEGGYGVGRMPSGTLFIVIRVALKSRPDEKMTWTFFEKRSGCFIACRNHERTYLESVPEEDVRQAKNCYFYYTMVMSNRVAVGPCRSMTIEDVMKLVKTGGDDLIKLC